MTLEEITQGVIYILIGIGLIVTIVHAARRQEVKINGQKKGYSRRLKTRK
jgi:hypothetical protein